MSNNPIQLAPGFWRTRDGRKVCVLGEHTMFDPNSTYKFIGYRVTKGGETMCWNLRGEFYGRLEDPNDIISPWESPIAPGHNPDKLTVEQVGEGWRLLDLDEVKRTNNHSKHIHKWVESGNYWDNTGWSGSSESYTYRTKLTREQLCPKTRLLRVEELPPVCWVMHSPGLVGLVTMRDTNTQHIRIEGNTDCYPISQFKSHQWSSDLKTWNPFTTTEP